MSDPEAVAAAKRALRQQVRVARDATDPADRAAWSGRICEHLQSLCDAAAPGVILSYVGFGSEIDTDAFNRAVLDRGCVLVLPRIDRTAGGLVLHRVHGLGADLVAGIWGILEPDPTRCQIVPYDAIEWMLLPGLAFDSAGGRLGYGGGYYDRLLPRLAGRRRIAAAFECQMVPAVPRGLHDASMDCIVTERGTAFPPPA